MTCIGLMSGTSVDGIDVAIVGISGKPPELKVRLRHFEAIPYEEEIRERIFRLFRPETSSVLEICDMNFALGHVYADAVLQTIRSSGIDPSEIAFISSHGQTVYHNPVPTRIGKYEITSTLQLGEASVIAEKTRIPVISDFRVRDMAAGGQGAPLVPFVDALLFSHPTKGRIAVNLGGIANLTVLPAGGSPDRCIAFDTGPANMIIDGLVRRITRGESEYDRDGEMARAGKVQEEYLKKWMALPYFAQRPPKSTGRELFGEQCVEEWWVDSQRLGIPPEDLVATATEYTIRTLAQAIRDFVLPHYDVEEVIAGGGGSYNPVLLEGIQKELPGLKIVRQEETGISADAKEAVAFAVLGYECYHRRPNNLPSATGAKHPVVMGKIVWK
ncbi:anhydro-N-acetylmuramic acid kinase [Effusibacillus lacus]|uniref:Anhydro-N-acetylmuramic acid kinase n=1 Tax=Effusibacillus lacus TaxID=1348429 RepID=A0A292YEL7_9BACL|nr:anhydro-N-acetylmuramic acid kinase [Effusibacillus lacus]